MRAPAVRGPFVSAERFSPPRPGPSLAHHINHFQPHLRHTGPYLRLSFQGCTGSAAAPVPGGQKRTHRWGGRRRPPPSSPRPPPIWCPLPGEKEPRFLPGGSFQSWGRGTHASGTLSLARAAPGGVSYSFGESPSFPPPPRPRRKCLKTV